MLPFRGLSRVFFGVSGGASLHLLLYNASRASGDFEFVDRRPEMRRFIETNASLLHQRRMIPKDNFSDCRAAQLKISFENIGLIFFKMYNVFSKR